MGLGLEQAELQLTAQVLASRWDFHLQCGFFYLSGYTRYVTVPGSSSSWQWEGEQGR